MSPALINHQKKGGGNTRVPGRGTWRLNVSRAHHPSLPCPTQSPYSVCGYLRQHPSHRLEGGARRCRKVPARSQTQIDPMGVRISFSISISTSTSTSISMRIAPTFSNVEREAANCVRKHRMGASTIISMRLDPTVELVPGSGGLRAKASTVRRRFRPRSCT
jgi:hypothetical protein